MTQSERLLQLLQYLQAARHPQTAAILADKMDISVRTLYRDIERLRRLGADIQGEAGIGFILHSTNFLLPPLTFSTQEIEALVLGMRWVAKQGEDNLTQAAKAVLSKIKVALPPQLSELLNQQSLFPIVETPFYTEQELIILPIIRQALREQRCICLTYVDAENHYCERSIWPLALGYFDGCRLLAAWCELRQAFRHFRIDRMTNLKLGSPYPLPKHLLLSKWQLQEKIDLSVFDF